MWSLTPSHSHAHAAEGTKEPGAFAATKSKCERSESMKDHGGDQRSGSRSGRARDPSTGRVLPRREGSTKTATGAGNCWARDPRRSGSVASALMTLAGASTSDRVAVRFAAQTSEVTGSFSTATTCMPRRAKAWESMPIPAVASTTLRTPAAASRLARRTATCGRLACSRPTGVVIHRPVASIRPLSAPARSSCCWVTRAEHTLGSRSGYLRRRVLTAASGSSVGRDRADVRRA